MSEKYLRLFLKSKFSNKNYKNDKEKKIFDLEYILNR